MALYTVAAPNTILVGDLNQYYQLLTGTMTDQAVTLGETLRIDNDNTNSGSIDLYLGTGSEGLGSKRTAGGNQNGLDLYANNAVALSISHSGNTTVQGTLTTSGGVTVSSGGLTVTGGGAFSGGLSGTTGTFSGAVSGTSGAFSGAVQSNSHPVVEGTTAATHAEVYPAQGSDSAIASGSGVSKTLTFARAFSSVPAVSAICTTSAGNKGAVGYSIAAISTTAVTVAFYNTDINSQMLSNYSIVAVGA